MELVATEQVSCGSVLRVRFTKTNDYLLCGGSDRTVRLWNFRTRGTVAAYPSPCREVTDVLSRSGNVTLICSGMDPSVYELDTETGTVLRRYQGHSLVWMH